MKEHLGKLGIDDHQEMFYIDEVRKQHFGTYGIVYTTGPHSGKNAVISRVQAVRYVNEYEAWRRRIDFMGGFR